jgi:hypothetical protein
MGVSGGGGLAGGVWGVSIDCWLKGHGSTVMEDRLVAVTSKGMQEARCGMISWLASRIEDEENLISDIRENIEIAKKSKWRMGPFRGQLNRREKELIWYQKVKEAIDQGFTLVPNFPCEIIAIRTDKKSPLALCTDSTYRTNNVLDENCSELPIGKGEYVSPAQRVRNSYYEDEQDGKIVKHYTQEAIEFQDPSFPFIIAKPKLLSATQEAMALRLFDEIAAFPGSKRRRGDPVVLGRLIHRKAAYSITIATFLIGWYVNLKDLA